MKCPFLWFPCRRRAEAANDCATHSPHVEPDIWRIIHFIASTQTFAPPRCMIVVMVLCAFKWTLCTNSLATHQTILPARSLFLAYIIVILVDGNIRKSNKNTKVFPHRANSAQRRFSFAFARERVFVCLDDDDDMWAIFKSRYFSFAKVEIKYYFCNNNSARSQDQKLLNKMLMTWARLGPFRRSVLSASNLGERRAITGAHTGIRRKKERTHARCRSTFVRVIFAPCDRATPNPSKNAQKKRGFASSANIRRARARSADIVEANANSAIFIGKIECTEKPPVRDGHSWSAPNLYLDTHGTTGIQSIQHYPSVCVLSKQIESMQCKQLASQ